MRWSRIHLQDRESVLTVLCQRRYAEIARRALCRAREELENYISGHRQFAVSFEPVIVAGDAPELVQGMARAAQIMHVGPMAAVAGAIAESVLLAVRAAGGREAVVDNGGDIVFYIEEPIVIGLWAGSGGVRDLALRFEPVAEPFSICTSSGTVGHSFSYGRADAAVALSKQAPLADAAATALGNRVRSRDDLEHAFDILKDVHEVSGALCFIGDRIAMWGEIPELVGAKVNQDLITQG